MMSKTIATLALVVGTTLILSACQPSTAPASAPAAQAPPPVVDHVAQHLATFDDLDFSPFTQPAQNVAQDDVFGSAGTSPGPQRCRWCAVGPRKVRHLPRRSARIP